MRIVLLFVFLVSVRAPIGCNPPSVGAGLKHNSTTCVGANGTQCVFTCSDGYVNATYTSDLCFFPPYSPYQWTGTNTLPANCTDINECAPSPNPCSSNAACTNTYGSYTCACNSGYTGNGVTCTDIDDCLSNPCYITATCANTPGSYTCTCATGYTGGTCTDINECEESPNRCSSNATCTNTPGSYTCTCGVGNIGDGITCTACPDAIYFATDFENDVPPTYISNAYSRNIAYQDFLAILLPYAQNIVSISTMGFNSDWVTSYGLQYGSDPSVQLDKYNSGDPIDANTDLNVHTFNLPDKIVAQVLVFTPLTVHAQYANFEVCLQVEDIDECAQSPSPCTAGASCTNTPGSFTCTCDTGYTTGDGSDLTCTDIDECAQSPSPCTAGASCTNTPGSYTCTCDLGYTTGDGSDLTCTDINECEESPNPCSSNATCTNTLGSYTCTCGAGNIGDGVTCTACPGLYVATDFHNGIAGGAAISDPYSRDITYQDYLVIFLPYAQNIVSISTKGFDSDWVTSYQLKYSPILTSVVVDYNSGDPVLANTDDLNVSTFNLPDKIVAQLLSFQPVAVHTQYANFEVCLLVEDIDYCASNPCSSNATCFNASGSYTCTCKSGFTGNGTNCTDINECTSSPCSSHGKCTNTVGSYSCACSTGYTGNGVNCTDVNECASSPCNTHATCANTPGSYSCACRPGFTGNGFTCTDINECTSSPCSSHAKCTNTIGSYSCTCSAGFTGNGVNCTATPKPTTPKRPTTIYLPNQITGADQIYFHTRKELNIEIKTVNAGPIPSGKISLEKDGVALGSQTLSNGQTKWKISNIPKQFQGLKKLKIVYSGDKTYASKTTVFNLFFFTIPQNGSYLINVNQSAVGHQVTYWNASRGGWNLKNKLTSNIVFYGWANSPKNYNCQTKFNIKNSPKSREVYDFTGVIAIKTIGTKGIASSSKTQQIVIVDTRQNPAGVGKVVASFCATGLI